MKLENKVQKYINHLYDAGVRGVSGDAHGMSVYDEQTIAQLLLQSTLPFNLPELNAVFNKIEFLDNLAEYMGSSDAMDGIAFIDGVVDRVVEFYRPKIKELMEETHARSQQNRVAG